MLERVPLLEKHLDDYAEIVAPGTLERIRELAAPLQGARVLHVNATAYGGGVAELLSTHVPLLRDVGLDADGHRNLFRRRLIGQGMAAERTVAGGATVADRAPPGAREATAAPGSRRSIAH